MFLTNTEPFLDKRCLERQSASLSIYTVYDDTERRSLITLRVIFKTKQAGHLINDSEYVFQYVSNSFNLIVTFMIVQTNV